MPSAKSVVSRLWWVRVDGDEVVLRPKVTAFAERLDIIALISVHHKGTKKENPHIHMCIEAAREVQKQSFAITIKKHFEVVDRNYALDIWDGDRTKGAPSYLFHEMGDVFVSKGWDADEITAAQRLGYQIAEEVDKAKEKASGKLRNKVLDHFVDCKPSRHEVLLWMLNEIQEGRSHHPGDFNLKNYTDETLLRAMDKNTLSNHAHHMVNNLWR